MSIYVSIGNSDDKLTQKEWSEFYMDVSVIMSGWADQVHGQWQSLPSSRWQNACWCFDTDEKKAFRMKQELRYVARLYRQDWIAWAEAETQEILPLLEEEA